MSDEKSEFWEKQNQLAQEDASKKHWDPDGQDHPGNTEGFTCRESPGLRILRPPVFSREH